MSDFTVDVSELAAAAAQLDAAEFHDLAGDIIGPQLDELGDVIAANVRTAARRHRRTGAMEGTIRARRSGSGFGELVDVTAGGPANMIIGGTRPHEIRPLAGRALPLAGKPGSFASLVHHPGTRPDPFVARGVQASAGDVAATLDRAGAQLVDRLAADLGGS